MNIQDINNKFDEFIKQSEPIGNTVPNGEYEVELTEISLDDQSLTIEWKFSVVNGKYEGEVITRLDDLNKDDFQINRTFNDIQRCKIDIKRLDDINSLHLKNVYLTVYVTNKEIKICSRIQ